METPSLVRGAILHILRLFLKGPRTGDEGKRPAYMTEDNLRMQLSTYYRVNLSEGDLRVHLMTLKDRGYVIYIEERIGVPPHQSVEPCWRISGDGVLLLTGERHDEFVAVPRWVH